MILAIIATILLASCQAQPDIDAEWNKEFHSATEIVDTYHKVLSLIDEEATELHTRNQCHYIWHCGEYMFSCRGKNPDIEELPLHITELDIDAPTVSSFMAEFGEERFADHYFTLLAMKRGESFDAARDGLTATVFFPIRALNQNDYSKLEAVFNSTNHALHMAYLEKLKFPLDNSGCNNELLAIRGLIEKNVAESSLKSEILSMYERYSNIIPGNKAPLPVLKDVDGHEHTFEEFNGKILVIDVWATWCSSCLKKMPEFIELKERYNNNPEIAFITVSIDRRNVKEKWLMNIKKRNMESMLNLFPDSDVQSIFESEYHISGIPRYIIIDKEGNIVTAYAPSPGNGLEEIIDSLVN